MSIQTYREKRREGTPEPRAGRKSARRSGRPRFVVQLHHASSRHYDFRLEVDGVLKSWAIPKGPSLDPGTKRLAVQVEDHPLDYAGFEGEIPKGHYGAGQVEIFDEGEWTPEGDPQQQLDQGHISFELDGRMLHGGWDLVRTRMNGKQPQWLLIKRRDRYAGAREADDFTNAGGHLRSGKPEASTRTAKRQSASAKSAGKAKPFEAQLAKLVGTPPEGRQWLHEPKWDGYRLLTTLIDGEPRLWSRNGLDWTERLPDIVEALRKLDTDDAELDGELVVLRRGRSDFNALQARLAGRSKASLSYQLFDLPRLNGEDLREQPLSERKQRLRKLLSRKTRGALAYSEHHAGDGDTVFATAEKFGLEGIVSKRADSPYRAGRGDDWRKIKRENSDEFVIVGYTEPKGSRHGFGALLLAEPDAEGGWHYVGRVGTGFSDELLSSLSAKLKTLQRKTPPVSEASLAERETGKPIWVRPELVAEVSYRDIAGLGLLRQAAFKTLREDKTVDQLEPTVAKVADLKLTHPQRIVFPDIGLSKADVADYYRTMADPLLAEIAGRPLSVLRCPDGIEGEHFFQKHRGKGMGEHVHTVPIEEKNGSSDYLMVDSVEGIEELVQMNVIEFHPWGATANKPDQCDRLVFDLDPASDLPFKRVIEGARMLRDRLKSLDLESFVRTTGGKGLHVVVPLSPAADWDAAKDFAHALASACAKAEPNRYVDVASKAKRDQRIFIDYLRNSRGATSVASYSLRARPGAPVAVPLRWEELGRLDSAAKYDAQSAPSRFKRLRRDPWDGFDRCRQSLTTALKRLD